MPPLLQIYIDRIKKSHNKYTYIWRVADRRNVVHNLVVVGNGDKVAMHICMQIKTDTCMPQSVVAISLQPLYPHEDLQFWSACPPIIYGVLSLLTHIYMLGKPTIKRIIYNNLQAKKLYIFSRKIKMTERIQKLYVGLPLFRWAFVCACI